MMLSASWRGKLVRRLSSSDVFDGSVWRIDGNAVVPPQSGHGCRPPCDCGRFSSSREGMMTCSRLALWGGNKHSSCGSPIILLTN